MVLDRSVRLFLSVFNLCTQMMDNCRRL
uniref:Uncharacterized protein n=1 Tax=Rhizophora mucronata TaxID=61149 RepID=A0A2P2NPW7_RHIMU